ncbi:MAG: helix-turn-helix domain-containing protein [Planctomycetes bacterium]|nr:helix-turn-helix domain-containing protein [Planctomycetota bacterium]
MASKFLTLDEAARHLGLAPEKLSELRTQGRLYGYRDGANWKFKADDLDRYQAELAEEQSQAAGASDLGMNLQAGSSIGSDNFDLKFDDEPAAEPTKKSAPAAANIGGEDEFELQLDDESAPAAAAPKAAPQADVHIETPEPSTESSDILAGAFGGGGGSGSIAGLSGIIAQDLLALDSGKDVHKEAAPPEPSASGSLTFGVAPDDAAKKAGDSDKGSDVLGSDSAPALINPTDSQLAGAAGGDTVIKRGSDLGEAAMSGLSLEKKDGGSSLKLGGDDEDDIFAATPGSDVTMRPSDSGILLVDPGDSGLSLEGPLDLGGSSGLDQTSAFAMGADTGELKADDDFLLTPLEEPGDESSDSGSQVIVLDETEPGAEPTATIMGLDAAALQGAFGEAAAMGGMGMPAFAPAGATQSSMAMVPMVRETPFSGVVVLMLTMCVVALGVCGVMIHDVMMNIWSWQGTTPFTSPLLEMLKK